MANFAKKGAGFLAAAFMAVSFAASAQACPLRGQPNTTTVNNRNGEVCTYNYRGYLSGQFAGAGRLPYRGPGYGYGYDAPRLPLPLIILPPRGHYNDRHYNPPRPHRYDYRDHHRRDHHRDHHRPHR